MQLNNKWKAEKVKEEIKKKNNCKQMKMGTQWPKIRGTQEKQF